MIETGDKPPGMATIGMHNRYRPPNIMYKG